MIDSSWWTIFLFLHTQTRLDDEDEAEDDDDNDVVVQVSARAMAMAIALSDVVSVPKSDHDSKNQGNYCHRCPVGKQISGIHSTPKVPPKDLGKND